MSERSSEGSLQSRDAGVEGRNWRPTLASLWPPGLLALWVIHAQASFRLDQGFPLLAAVVWSAAAALLAAVVLKPAAPPAPWWNALKGWLSVAAGTAALAWLMGAVGLRLPVGWAAVWLGVATAAAFAGLRLASRPVSPDDRTGEIARVMLLVVWASFLLRPFYTSQSIGLGDAYWYVGMLGDTITQIRAGVFPVWIGQSEYAFNGAITPLRFAPWFQYSGALLDSLTGFSLTPMALKNALMALHGVAGALSAYFCLRAVLPQHRGFAAGIAAVYVASPGLLAPLYVGDQYMTYSAVPFLPIVAYGMWRVAIGGRSLGRLALPIGLAGLWLSHPPLGLWMTLAAGVVYLVSAIRHREWRGGPATRLALLAVVFVVLGSFPFLSVLTIDNQNPTPLDPEGAVGNVLNVFPDNVLPIDPQRVHRLETYQLGWGTLGLLGAGLYLLYRGGWRSRGSGAGALLLVIVLLAPFALPVPWVTRWVWLHAPRWLLEVNNIWPTQRLFAILATLFAFVGAAAMARAWPLSQRAIKIIGVLLLPLGVVWSAWEAQKLVRFAEGVRENQEETTKREQPHNAVLSRYAYAPFSNTPSYVSHGYMDPWLENRLLDRSTLRVVLTNAEGASGGENELSLPAAGRVVTAGTFSAVHVAQDEFHLRPALSLHPGRHYALRFNFRAEEPPSILWVDGPGLKRRYDLPDSAVGLQPHTPSRSFGMKASSSKVMPLQVTGSNAATLTIKLRSPERRPAGAFAFADFQLFEYEPASLPINVTNWMPYEATVQSPVPTFLETPRMWLGRYQAWVNGEPVEPQQSPENLVMIPLGAGKNEVRLAYVPPWWLSLSLWLGLAGWSVVVIGGVALSSSRALPQLSGWLDDRERSRAIEWGSRAVLAGFGVALVALAWPAVQQDWQERRAAGPVALQTKFPVSRSGAMEPLLSVGNGKGSTVVFVQYVDVGAVRFGVDVWGITTRYSEPVSVDRNKLHTVEISTGALYSPERAELQQASARQLEWLQQTTRVVLDGEEVFLTEIPTEGVQFGRPYLARNRTGGASFPGRYTGPVINPEWLSADDAGFAIPSSETLEREPGPIHLRLDFPSDAIEQCEPLLSVGEPGTGYTIFAHYINPREVRLGVQGGGFPFTLSDPLPIDYKAPQQLIISGSDFDPEPGAEGASAASTGSLVQRILRVELNGASALYTVEPAAERLITAPLLIGLNEGHASYANPDFTGRVRSVRRVATGSVSGPNLDAVRSADAVGPIELTVRLPQQMTGRAQPLLTTGEAGAGTFVFVRYLSENQIQVGSDVWGVGLYWSEPITVDYAEEQTFRISSSALYPLGHPRVQAMDPAVVEQRRKQLIVHHDGKVVLEENVFAHESTPEQITLGASRIGGSHTEPSFMGEIVRARRVP